MTYMLFSRGIKFIGQNSGSLEWIRGKMQESSCATISYASGESPGQLVGRGLKHREVDQRVKRLENRPANWSGAD